MKDISRTILHIDMNTFYASVELLYHPELRDKPLAVGGDPELRHGIVLTKSQLAKKAGVKTGMALWQARQLCPEIVFIPPHYDRYMRFSRMAREIYGEYTDLVEPFGLDEVWADVSASRTIKGDGRQIAEEIRARIKRELGLTVSIGISWNKIFAKFGSDYKKPDAITEITKDNYRDIVWRSPVEDLLYVGRSSSRKLHAMGICTIGDLARTDPVYLQTSMGKMGLILYMFAIGEDQAPVAKENTSAPIKSIGNGITTPRDLVDDTDMRVVIYMLAESVGRRLRENHFMASVIEVGVRDNALLCFTRQQKITSPTNITSEIAQHAIRIFRANYRWEKPVRSVTVRASSLVPDTIPYQTNLFEDESARQKRMDADAAVDDIRRRFGYFSVQRGLMLTDNVLSHVDAKEAGTIHPRSYFV
uniref:DNA polymerase IV n=1 Tax=Eubacterium cellulosolvens TaxID=29322 RepID=UPI00048616C0|nr:DNA polymerase IV [[Eubacterium] cellulosolvens]